MKAESALAIQKVEVLDLAMDQHDTAATTTPTNLGIVMQSSQFTERMQVQSRPESVSIFENKGQNEYDAVEVRKSCVNQSDQIMQNTKHCVNHSISSMNESKKSINYVSTGSVQSTAKFQVEAD